MVGKLGETPIRVLIVEDNRDICENIAALHILPDPEHPFWSKMNTDSGAT